MPTYEKNKDGIVLTPENMVDFINAVKTKTKKQRDDALLATMWITGARPIEIRQLRKRDIYPDPEHPDYYLFILKNSKRTNNPKNKWLERTLVIHKDSPFMDYIVQYISAVNDPDARLFPISTAWIRELSYKASGDSACPYTFRHTRLTRLSWRRKTEYDLRQWKGGGSVSHYLIYAVPSAPTMVD